VVAVEADAQSRQQYAGVLTKTMAAITALYVVLSVFAFACFGDATSANIMLNLGSDIYVNLVRVTVSCTLLVNIAMVREHGQEVLGGRRTPRARVC
jgi:amino acid permease